MAEEKEIILKSLYIKLMKSIMFGDTDLQVYYAVVVSRFNSLVKVLQLKTNAFGDRKLLFSWAQVRLKKGSLAIMGNMHGGSGCPLQNH